MCGVCTDWTVPRWLMAAQKCSTGASGQIKACPLLCFNRRLCISLCLCACLRVCWRVWIVGFFHPGSCMLECVCFVLPCVHESRVSAFEQALSPLALPVRVCTRWHPLTYSSICPPPGGHPILPSLCVYRADTQYPPLPTSRTCMCREGNPVSAFHHGEARHVFIPPPFPLIRPGAVHLTVVWGHARLRTGVQSFTHAGCPTSFSSWYSLWRGCFWKHCQEKKKYCWRLSRDVCWQLLCVTSLMYASWKKHQN